MLWRGAWIHSLIPILVARSSSSTVSALSSRKSKRRTRSSSAAALKRTSNNLRPLLALGVQLRPQLDRHLVRGHGLTCGLVVLRGSLAAPHGSVSACAGAPRRGAPRTRRIREKGLTLQKRAEASARRPGNPECSSDATAQAPRIPNQSTAYVRLHKILRRLEQS